MMLGTNGTASSRAAFTAGIACALCVACGAFTSAAIADSSVTVNTTAASSPSGDGLCSLAEAVGYSNGSSEPDCSATARSGTTTIKLQAGAYTIGGTLELDLATDIVGTGATGTDIDGGDSTQVLNVDSSAVVTISGVEISDGNSGDSTVGCTGSGQTLDCPHGELGKDGGGIDNIGTLTLDHVAVTNNHAAAGTGPIKSLLSAFCTTVCDGGNGATGGSGGGIYNAGTLTLNDSTVTGNGAGVGGSGADGQNGPVANGPGANGGTGADGGYGGGIFNEASSKLTVSDSTISGNTSGAGGAGGSGTDATGANSNGGGSGLGGDAGNGAGIENQGALTMTGSTLTDNTTGSGGDGGTPGAGTGLGVGGIAAYGGSGGTGAALDTGNASTVALLNTTVTANIAGAAGKGIHLGSGGGGAGINDLSLAGITLVHVTIADNVAAIDAAIGGFANRPVTETDSIIASNVSTQSGAPSCGVVDLSDGGHNIAFAASGCPGATGDPKLGPLANNGGPTQTMALGAGSSAVDIVPTVACGVTTDQRGIERPFGAGCDAGAYESAPPVIGLPSGVATGPNSATVSGQITPDLTDAKVVVDYGTATSYGSTSGSTDVGNGTTATPFSVALSGLVAGATYHAKVVATNQDGTTASGDLTFTTPIAMTASVPKGGVNGNTVAVTVTCAANGPACSGTLKLQSRVTTKGKKVVAVAASGKKRPKPKRKTKLETVGSGRYTLTAGKTKVVKLTLNASGKRLLKARHRLPTIVTITGGTKLTEKVTFDYKPPRKKKR
jgi:hypothetical protein